MTAEIGDNLKPLLAEYGNLRSNKKDIDARIKELDPEVRPLLKNKGAVVVGNYMFELTENSGRKTLDKAALIADGIDVEKYMRVGAPFTALKVKELGA